MRGRLLDLISVVALLGAIAFAIGVMVPRPRGRAATKYRTVTELVSVPIHAVTRSDGSEVWLAKTRPHVIYFFSTTCAFCESQRQHIGRLLTTLPDSTVITASVEPSARTADYWKAVDADLPPPISVDTTWLRLLGLKGVPTLIFVDTSGIIRNAITGVVLEWSPATIREELAQLARLGP